MNSNCGSADPWIRRSDVRIVKGNIIGSYYQANGNWAIVERIDVSHGPPKTAHLNQQVFIEDEFGKREEYSTLGKIHYISLGTMLP